MSSTMPHAAAIMFLAMSLIPAGDAAGKVLTTQGIAPVYVAWSRFLIGALLILPFFGREARSLAGDWRIWLRGALLACGITSIQTALKTAPIGDVFAAFFVGPLVSYILAGLFLKEPMSKQRTALVFMGFIGVLLVVRPGGAMQPGLLFAVLAGVFYGAFLTASRWVSDVASPGALSVSQLIIGAILLTPLGWPNIPPLTPAIIGLTLASAAFSMAGNFILLFAYRMAPATSLSPLVYFQLFAAVLLGWLVFGDLPDLWTLCGMAIILAAGITVARLR